MRKKSDIEYVFLIYVITNIKNGKKYVGKTKRSVLRRWNDHIRQAKRTPSEERTYFYNSIVKYGKEGFFFEVLDFANSVEELNRLEIEYIKIFDCQIRSNEKNGYNVEVGGDRSPLHEQTIKKQSDKRRGKKHSQEHKDKIKASCQGMHKGTNNPFFGKKHTEETLNKKRGKKHTEEHKKKISEGGLRRWEKYRLGQGIKI